MVKHFKYAGWEIEDAIEALMAWDLGARDSGVNDPGLRGAVVDYLALLDENERRRLLARVGRRYLTEEAVDQGYGLEDAAQLMEWANEIMPAVRF